MNLAAPSFKKTTPNVSIKGIKILPLTGGSAPNSIRVQTKILIEVAINWLG